MLKPRGVQSRLYYNHNLVEPFGFHARATWTISEPTHWSLGVDESDIVSAFRAQWKKTVFERFNVAYSKVRFKA
jgi:hypothetical protein